MASKTYVPVAATQGTTPSLLSSTGFFPIRAPVTVDGFQSDGYKTDSSESNISGSSCVDNEFASGEEDFDTASERPFLGDPDEENSEEGGFGGRYRVSWPFAGDPDEESLVLAEEEESSVTDEFGSVVELDNANSNGVRPIAQLSMDDDELYEVAGDEGMMNGVEDGRLSDVVKVPSFGVQEREDTVLRVKALGTEEEKEDELLVQSNSSSVDNQSGLLMERDEGPDNVVLGPKDAVVMNGSVNDSSSVNLVEDNSHAVTVIQPINLLVKDESPETSEGDRMEDLRESYTTSYDIKDEANLDSEIIGGQEGLLSDDRTEELIFGGSGTTKHIMNGLPQNLAFSSPPVIEAYHDHPQTIDGQITMDSDEDTDSDEEADVVKEPVGKQLFDYDALAALLKAATGVELDGGRIAISSVDGSGLFSLERPAGSGFPFHSKRPAPPPDVLKCTLSEEEEKILEKIHNIRVKFLRLVQRLGQSPEDSIVESVLHRLDPGEGKRFSRVFSLENA
jgi:hypothetical protein